MDDIDFLNFRKVLTFDNLGLIDKSEQIVCFKNKFYKLSYTSFSKEIEFKLLKILCENYTYKLKDNPHYIDITDNEFYEKFFTLNEKAYRYNLEEINDEEILHMSIYYRTRINETNVSNVVKKFIEENTMPPK